MNKLISYNHSIAGWLSGRIAPATLPTLARFTFAATLLVYFWASAQTKLGMGPFGFAMPSLGAYVQIFPKAMEAVGYDASQLALWQRAVVIAGTAAEFALPLLLVLGLATRLAALGMIGFILVQTLTDLFGHGALAQPETLGAWFDRIPTAPILDQRLIWVTLLSVPLFLGAGPISLDRLIQRRVQAASG